MKKLPIFLTLSCLSAAQAQEQPDTIYTIKMLPVEGGSFEMGGTHELFERERPIHTVAVSSFAMSETEITQAQWLAVMGTLPKASTEGDNYPVLGVSWYEAVDFCNALSRKEGKTPAYTIDKINILPKQENSGDDIRWRVTCDWKANGYRLPTEAEWEYAARGGKQSQAYIFSGSNVLNEVAWWEDNAGTSAHVVKSKKPNELGLYDLSGNVEEWCWDWYDAAYYAKSSATDPRGPKSGSYYRVLRGGDWAVRSGVDGFLLRACHRDYGAMHVGTLSYGFRVVARP